MKAFILHIFVLGVALTSAKQMAKELVGKLNSVFKTILIYTTQCNCIDCRYLHNLLPGPAQAREPEKYE